MDYNQKMWFKFCIAVGITASVVLLGIGLPVGAAIWVGVFATISGLMQ